MWEMKPADRVPHASAIQVPAAGTRGSPASRASRETSNATGQCTRVDVGGNPAAVSSELRPPLSAGNTAQCEPPEHSASRRRRNPSSLAFRHCAMAAA